MNVLHKKIKFSKRFDEDYDFYLLNCNRYNFAGKDVVSEFKIIESCDGLSTKECFYHYDSSGTKEFICKDKDELIKIIICKASVNLHIKMYAEGFAEYSLSLKELKDIASEIKAPDWFLQAITKQAAKIISKKPIDLYSTISIIELACDD